MNAKRDSLYVRLLPLSIAAIVATTVIPVKLRWPSLVFLDTAIDRRDVVNNLLLYLPLGVALARGSIARCFGAAFGLSFFAELIQFGCVNRDPSPVDVAANVTGALAGLVLGRAVHRLTGHSAQHLKITKPLASGCIFVAALSIFGLAWHRTRADFSNWDPSCELAIGNELTCDRPWHGTVDALAIYADAVSAEQVEQLAISGPSAVGSADGGTIPNRLFYRSEQPSPVGGCPEPLLAEKWNEIFFDNLQRSGQLTILAWITPSDVAQKGPARIVTYSRDASRRNFTLGQTARSLTFRLRTPGTGVNGTSPALFTSPVLRMGRQSFVAVTYDGDMSKAYVDGKLVAQVNLSARRPRFPSIIIRRLPGPLPLADLETNICEIAVGCLAGIGILGLITRSRWPWALGAGALCGLLIWIFCASEVRLGLRILVLSVLGALAAALSVIRNHEMLETGSPNVFKDS